MLALAFLSVVFEEFYKGITNGRAESLNPGGKSD